MLIGIFPRQTFHKFTCSAALLLILSVIMCPAGLADGWLDSSKAANEILNSPPNDDGVRLRLGGIANTRHNLTMSYNGANPVMDRFRNNYYEICVYCHTPHGANSTAAAPLWNRTVTAREYTLYNQGGATPSSLDLTYTQPGPNSLTCLSCHDGATAIDSIINMPTQLEGSFRAGYKESQETTVDKSFLDQWSGNKLGTGSPGDLNSTASGHAGFNSRDGSFCLSCHNPGNGNDFPGNGALGPDFSIFSIGDQFVGKDATGNVPAQVSSFLADDHPIGVRYPSTFNADIDYNEPDVKTAKIAFFDNNNNRHADPEEIRLYDTGDGYEVECGSCHDPHGVKIESATENDQRLVPSFLRVGSDFPSSSNSGSNEEFPTEVRSNVGSKLCLTCHIK